MQEPGVSSLVSVRMNGRAVDDDEPLAGLLAEVSTPATA